MAQADEKAETTLKLSRVFRASPERLFEAWTKPEALSRWFGPSPEMTVPVADVDLRVGGNYRITMQNLDGEQFTAIGVYREIKPAERLVFTWVWEQGGPDVGETEVTLEFRAAGPGTELTLTHTLFPDSGVRDHHGEGWSGSLDCLETYLAS